MNGALPAAVILRDVVHAARLRNASDIHLDSGVPPVLRIDGQLEILGERALLSGELRAIADQLLMADPPGSSQLYGDATVACDDSAYGGALRAHVYSSASGATVAMRLLDRDIPSLESLHLPEVVAGLAQRERGIVIFAGPTGSGKSTTMAALIDRINTQSARRIITIEDPIEYRHPNRRSLVTQREIGRDTPDLHAALHGVLRADPDVIVVGEMRDPHTISAALTAAETGHLVLTTLHTGDACQTVDRIVDAFEGAAQAQIRVQLAQVLVAVVCQRLVKRSAGSGRRAAVEILVATDAVRNLIRESKAHHLKNAIATGRAHGMQTLEQHVAELLASHVIDDREAARLGVALPATADGLQ